MTIRDHPGTGDAERMGFVIAFAVLATVAAIVAVAIGSDWVLIPALAVAAAGLVAVLATVSRLMREPEQERPASAA